MVTRWRPSSACNFVIFDIHSNIDLLNKILKPILPLRTHVDIGTDRLIVVGDLIDRGSFAFETVERIIELKKEYGDQVIVILGNHEAILLKILNKDPRRTHSLQTMEACYQMWTNPAVGGVATGNSYLRRSLNRELTQDDSFNRTTLNSIIPKHHIEFFQSMLPYYKDEENETIYVHGGMNPYEPIENQDVEVLIWDRDLVKHAKEKIEKAEEMNWKYTVVCGHSVQDSCRPIFGERYLMGDIGSPKQLLCVEMNSLEAKIAHNDSSQAIKYDLLNFMKVN